MRLPNVSSNSNAIQERDSIPSRVPLAFHPWPRRVRHKNIFSNRPAASIGNAYETPIKDKIRLPVVTDAGATTARLENATRVERVATVPHVPRVGFSYVLREILDV